MKKIALTAAISASALALAACGDSNDASIDAEAETVEEPAEVALEDVTEEPVEDADVAEEATEAVRASVQAEAETAQEEAEATVADIEALLEDAQSADDSGDTTDPM